jgi:outer membrane biosynthesis protein TonB
MTPDILREAARALRETADESTARPDETRARVLRSLQAQRSRRLAAIRYLVPLAAVFVGSVAWASATHRMPDAWYEVAAAIGLASQDAPEEPPAPPPRAPRAPEPETPEPAQAEPPAADISAPVPQEVAEAKEDAPNPPAPPEEARVSSAPAAPTAPAAAMAEPPAEGPPAATAPAPVDPDAHALYQTAHRTHFAEGNPSAAFAAWNAYLAAAPRGRFAVEAHYNRALCLVRLGRTEEGKKALEPFARGSFGGYRQAEAQKLLDAMGGDTP